jgi:2-polyprenyl-3-methyl-5-hydroxy-6-metoxy-1,4-benzoquinol methylase
MAAPASESWWHRRRRHAVGAARSTLGRLGVGTVDEHFVPGDDDLAHAIAAGDASAVHHLIRYHWAVAVLAEVRPRRILDVACGAGYGSARLAEALPEAEVVGVDLDARAVEQARERYRRPNLAFRVGDVQRWSATVGDDLHDAIVSFDTIEHVEHRELMLLGIVDHLAPDGALLLSTPSARSTVTLDPSWRHHRIEYSAPVLHDLMHRYFRVVLTPDEATLPHGDVFDQLDGTPITYARRMNPLVCREPIRFSGG